MSAEDKFNEIVLNLKTEMNKYIEDAIDDIHLNMIPYVNDDTEANAIYRSSDIVNQILSGFYKIEDSKIVCNGWSTNLTDNDHDRLVDKLAEKCSDEAAKQKIARLERQLEESYKRI